MSENRWPTSDNPDRDVAAGAQLSLEDSAAMDALVEAGFEIERVPAELRARAERVATMLGVLSVSQDSADVEVMLDAVLARVRLVEQRASATPTFSLSGNDEDALESLIAAGYAPESVPTVLRRRAEKQSRLLGLLEPSKHELGASSELVGRTLARVQGAVDRVEASMKIEPARVSGRRIRMADLMTVAAMLLIAAAAVGPMVGAFREQARQAACQGNLQAAGIGFGAYANDFRDALPMASVARAGTPWWFVGRPDQSNSANMFTLARTGYTKLDQLACAGNSGACRGGLGTQARDWRSLDEVSYSYQNLFGRDQALLRGDPGSVQLIVAVDGSPVVRRAFRGLSINPLANSMNHQGKGQNALYNDGHVEWLNSPVLSSGEHIWLPHIVEQAIGRRQTPTQAEPIKGNELPAGADDVFVGP